MHCAGEVQAGGFTGKVKSLAHWCR
jgi:hypothetical protein